MQLSKAQNPPKGGRLREKQVEGQNSQRENQNNLVTRLEKHHSNKALGKSHNIRNIAELLLWTLLNLEKNTGLNDMETPKTWGNTELSVGAAAPMIAMLGSGGSHEVLIIYFVSIYRVSVWGGGTPIHRSVFPLPLKLKSIMTRWIYNGVTAN